MTQGGKSQATSGILGVYQESHLNSYLQGEADEKLQGADSCSGEKNGPLRVKEEGERKVMADKVRHV